MGEDAPARRRRPLSVRKRIAFGCFTCLFLLGGAEAALAASIFHYGEYTIAETKRIMRAAGVPVRL